MSYDDEIIVDEPLSPEDLADIRKARGNPNYKPASGSTPEHEGWTDDEQMLINPFLRFTREQPPTLEETGNIFAGHKTRVARPDINMYDYYWKTHELVMRLCDRMGPAWQPLKQQMQTRLAAHRAIV